MPGVLKNQNSEAFLSLNDARSITIPSFSPAMRSLSIKSFSPPPPPPHTHTPNLSRREGGGCLIFF